VAVFFGTFRVDDMLSGFAYRFLECHVIFAPLSMAHEFGLRAKKDRHTEMMLGPRLR
jgi:hypothetical protein